MGKENTRRRKQDNKNKKGKETGIEMNKKQSEGEPSCSVCLSTSRVSLSKLCADCEKKMSKMNPPSKYLEYKEQLDAIQVVDECEENQEGVASVEVGGVKNNAEKTYDLLKDCKKKRECTIDSLRTMANDISAITHGNTMIGNFLDALSMIFVILSIPVDEVYLEYIEDAREVIKIIHKNFIVICICSALSALLSLRLKSHSKPLLFLEAMICSLATAKSGLILLLAKVDTSKAIANPVIKGFEIAGFCLCYLHIVIFMLAIFGTILRVGRLQTSSCHYKFNLYRKDGAHPYRRNILNDATHCERVRILLEKQKGLGISSSIPIRCLKKIMQWLKLNPNVLGDAKNCIACAEVSCCENSCIFKAFVSILIPVESMVSSFLICMHDRADNGKSLDEIAKMFREVADDLKSYLDSASVDSPWGMLNHVCTEDVEERKHSNNKARVYLGTIQAGMLGKEAYPNSEGIVDLDD